MFEKCLAAGVWRGRQVAIGSSPDSRVRDLKGLASLIPWRLDEFCPTDRAAKQISAVTRQSKQRIRRLEQKRAGRSSPRVYYTARQIWAAVLAA
jgi:hypothetical protein